MRTTYDKSKSLMRTGNLSVKNPLKRAAPSEGGYYQAVGQTGIAPVDKAVTRTLQFEQSYLGNPLVQVTLLGLAGFGAYTLIMKYIK